MKLYARRNIKNYLIVFLFLFFSLIFCEKEQEFHFNTYTTFHENDDKTVTYEHCGSNDQGDFSFSATFEHTSYDTCQNITCSDISFNYQSDENVQTSEQETLNNSSLKWSDYHDQISDADQYDFNEIFNNQNENNSTNFDQKNNGLEQNKKALKNKHKKFQNKIKEAEHFLENELQRAYDEHQLSLQGSDDQKFTKIVKKRNQLFEQSLQDQKKCKNQDFVLKNSTIGFMQANNIDYHQFIQLQGLQIQHHVTQELIANLNTFADIANKNFGNQQFFPLIQSGALVTSMAQDYNQASQLCDAISATNCSHGFVHYLQGMMVSGHNRCQKLLTSLSFFNCEIAKYTAAIARGVTIGVVASEVIDLLIAGIGKGASILAPQLTSAVYSGATSIIVPIALTVGILCAAGIIIEGTHLGYLYGTDQLDKVAIELDRIKNFAGQFYNFDQASEKHVENIAMLSTTAVWPWQKQAIFEHLMGMQKVTCNLLVDAKNVVQQTRKVTQNQLHNAFEYIKNSELQQFDILYKKILDEHIFDFIPKNQPCLVPAGMHGFIDPADKAMLSQRLKTTGSSAFDHGIKFTAVQIALINDVTSKFLETDVGPKVLGSVTKLYEEIFFKTTAKKYNKMLESKAPQEVIDTFCKCHELSIVPKNITQDFETLHTIFKDRYVGLEEFNAINQYLTMQVRHIFYPSLEPKLHKDSQSIKQFDLNGFHHDEYNTLEKNGLFTYVDKIYGNAKFGAEECFKAKTDWGSEIICDEKTFFPSSWSREKTVQVIFEAAQNRIKFLGERNRQYKFECKGPNNLVIDIVINAKNRIISAYPSIDNF